MITIEKDKEYNIRLMPNYYDIPKKILELQYSFKDQKPFLAKKYLSYVLNSENKIDFIFFGQVINKYIKQCFSGYYGTSEGYFITDELYDDQDGFYYANKDKSLIIYPEEEINYDESKNMTKFTDIVYYKPFYFYDIKEKFNLNFKTRNNTGFLEIYNIRMIEDKPLYKDGDDKNIIKSLYNNVEKLDVVLENHKKELLEKYPNILFDNEANKYIWEQKNNIF